MGHNICGSKIVVFLSIGTVANHNGLSLGSKSKAKNRGSENGSRGFDQGQADGKAFACFQDVDRFIGKESVSVFDVLQTNLGGRHELLL